MTSFQYEDLGTKDYKECWDYQEDLMKEIIDKKLSKKEPISKNHFLLVEHPHVYTLGRSGNTNNLLVDKDFLNKIKATYYKIDRGGDITYHGPGQLVGYPIIDLEYYNLGIKQYIGKMENAIIDIIGHYGIKGGLKKGATGVWIDADDLSKARKICAIGVRASRYVTMHGFALNVNTNLKYFSYINPCGFTDYGVTSIEKEIGQKIDMNEIKKLTKEAFNKIF
ncbi:MAG: lipoyl(octanoyl) transferase LipB [Prolixibacteraceae bacterium]|nr:lipoyl(octanoyl) transferase LipB [Prolixibacteraceae bacterium]